MERARLRQIGIVLLIAVAVPVAACGNSREEASKRPGPQSTSAEVASLLAGIPQHGNTLGNPRASVLVQYFGDLECPYCRQFTLGALRTLIENYVRAGRLKIEYRSLQTATRDAKTFKTQQVAALAAGEQDKMWNFIELFYHEQGQEDTGYASERYLQGLALQVPGLNLIAWTAARSDPALANAIIADERYALAAGIRQTPSFVLGREGNPPYISAIRKLLRS